MYSNINLRRNHRLSPVNQRLVPLSIEHLVPAPYLHQLQLGPCVHWDHPYLPDSGHRRGAGSTVPEFELLLDKTPRISESMYVCMSLTPVWGAGTGTSRTPEYVLESRNLTLRRVLLSVAGGPESGHLLLVERVVGRGLSPDIDRSDMNLTIIILKIPRWKRIKSKKALFQK